MKGLYLNDLSMTDNSRDMILVGHQHASNIELTLDKVNSFITTMCQYISILDKRNVLLKLN